MKRTILVPFVCIILLGFGFGWAFYVRGSREAVLKTVDLLALEAASRVRDRMDAYLGTAAEVAEINAAFIGSAMEPSASLPPLSRSFRRQLLERSEVDLISVGFSDGEYAEAQRMDAGTVRIGQAGRRTGGALVLERTDEQGRPVAEDLRRPDYDPRKRPWYLAAASAGALVWTRPYPIVSTGELTMAAAVPLYDHDRLSGVVTADLRLGALSAFLASIVNERRGLAYVIDAGGLLIASSDGTPLADENSERHSLSKHGGPASAILTASFLAGGAASLRIGDTLYRAVSLPFKSKGGLEWEVLIALPEKDFMAPLSSMDIRAALVLVATLAGALTLAFFIADQISEPLRLLGGAVSTLEPVVLGGNEKVAAEEEASRTIAHLATRGDEIGRLAHSFEELSSHLEASFASLHASLEEKEILLKEVHHRVKNNLQIVSSLLSLQAGVTDDPALGESLSCLQERVQAMAFVHEDMYGSGDFSSVRMESYFRKICESLSVSRQQGCAVFVDLEPCEVLFPLEKALPCGLILSELVTNAFKHAFTGRARGRVRILLSEEEGGYRLVVEDDGVGIGSAERRGNGIGSSLVEGLASQLKGSLERRSDARGTVITLHFPA